MTLEELFSDKVFVEDILKMSPEDAAKAITEKGVEVTAEDLKEAMEIIKAGTATDELNEDELKEVSGGASKKKGKNVADAVLGYGVGAGLVIGTVLVVSCSW